MTRPEHNTNVLHTYADSDWTTCVKTRRSFGGIVFRLAGGTIAYKYKFQSTVAGSLTEAEFMAANDAGKMILFVRSVYGTWGSFKRPLPYSMKTTTHVPPCQRSNAHSSH